MIACSSLWAFSAKAQDDVWPDQQAAPAPAQPNSSDAWPDAPGQPQIGPEQAAATAPPGEAPVPEQEPAGPVKPAPTWWFGAYGQAAVVPAFLLGLFLDESPSVAKPGFGLLATHRDKDGFSLVLGLGFQSYSFAGPFRISGDPLEDTEYLSSTLALLHLRGEMLWSTDIVKDTLSFEYGFGLDLGVVLGQLRRSEAYRGNLGTWERCARALDPPTLSPSGEPYCELPTRLPTDGYKDEGAHYNVQEKRVPPIVPIPMLPVLALRYTPVREVAIKLDVAFGLMQFVFGLSAAYGVDI